MQLSYAIDIPAVAFPGQIADLSAVRDTLSAINVLAAIPFGVLAVHDTANGAGFDALACKVPDSAALITALGSALGVVMADQARAQDPNVAVPTIPIKSAVSCGRKGRFWVLSETAVEDGDPVYVRFLANGALTQLGAFRNDADTTAGPVDHAALLPGARWRGKVAAPGYAVIEMDLV